MPQSFSMQTDSATVSALLTEHRDQTPLDLAHGLLYDGGAGLYGLLQMPEAQLQTAVGDANATRLMAAIEFAKRMARAQMPERRPLGDITATARYLNMRYDRDDQEVMGALYTDTRGNIIAEREHYAGRLDGVSVEPRAVLREALMLNATAVMVFHNHPSGDTDPSSEDISFTRRLSRAAAAVGLDLVDHLIIGGGRWTSLRERQLI